ncbi:tail fiber protein proximal subunit [Serratia phage 92A1]|nr:tail fiber protein proximal subunit [Serratia phage 92A1]
MAELPKLAFRATEGLDAADEKLINLKKTDLTKENYNDGVSVDFFVEHNSIQQYDSARSYFKYQAVIYQNRPYYAKADIAKPSGTAGAFDVTKWQALRVDPTWIMINETAVKTILAGEYIAANTSFKDLTFKMPLEPVNGDTIVVKDIGGMPGQYAMLFNTSGKKIRYQGTDFDSWYNTRPFSTVLFIYTTTLAPETGAAGIWIAQVQDDAPIQKKAIPGKTILMQAGDNWYRKTSAGVITMELPLYANDGDAVKVCDIDNANPINHTVFSVNAKSGHKIDGKVSNFVPTTAGDGMFVYDASAKNWVVYDADIRARTRLVAGDALLLPNSVNLVNANTSTKVTLTLPANVGEGDLISVSLKNVRRGQTVEIVCAKTGGEIIHNNEYDIVRYSQQGTAVGTGLPRTAKLTYTGTDSYLPVLVFSAFQNGDNWFLYEASNNIERVDAKNRARYGVAPLAAQSEVDKNKEQNPDDESIVTPLTLSSKIASESMRGIAYLASQADAQKNGTAGLDHSKIMTVQRMDNRRATTDRAGVAETATDAETADNTNRTHIVTPAGLNSRRATEVLAGIAALVISNPNGATTDRTKPGVSGTVFDSTDHAKVTTPKVLSELKATTKQYGLVLVADQNEVNAGASSATYPLVVTAGTLNSRKATETLDGLIELATDAEVKAGTDTVRAVTPKTLNDRRATESLSGLSRFATETEFAQGLKVAGSGSGVNAQGTLSVDPEKIKNYFSDSSRVLVRTDSGLVQAGNIWTQQVINIVEPTETKRGTTSLASQTEVNTGTQANKIVTPATLHNKRAGYGVDLWGLTRYASNAEMAITVNPPSDYVVSVQKLQQAFKGGSSEYTHYQATAGSDASATRGVVKLASEELTKNGANDLTGTNGIDLSTSKHDGWAVSPRNVQSILQLFLPAKATSVNSSKLNGLTSDQFIRKDIDQTVAGGMTWNKGQAFQNTISVSGDAGFRSNVVIDSASTDGTTAGALGPQLTVGRGSGDTSAVIRFNAGKGSVRNNWQVIAGGTSTWAATDEFVIATAQVSPVKALTVKTSGDVNVGRNLSSVNSTVDGGFLIAAEEGKSNGFTVATRSTNGNMRLGTTNQNVEIYTNDAGYNGLTLYRSGNFPAATILNTRNFNGHLDGTYVKRTGGLNSVMSGAVVTYHNSMPPTAINPEINNSTGLHTYVPEQANTNDPTKYPNGMWVMSIDSKAVFDTYPVSDPAKGTRSVGSLLNFSYSQYRTTQFWYPKGSVVWYTRTSSNTNAQFTPWARVYTDQYPPTAEEIGALVAEGSIANNMTIRDWIQIGNVRIRANNDTKTVEFEWVGN